MSRDFRREKAAITAAREQAVQVIDGTKVRACREACGLSQQELAVACGWPDSAAGQVAVSRIEQQEVAGTQHLAVLVSALDSALRNLGDEQGCAPEDLLSSLALVKKRRGK